MAKGPLQPTAGQVVERARRMEQYYRAQDEEIRKLRLNYELKEVVPIPKELERVVGIELSDATILDEIDRTTAALLLNEPKCIVTAGDPQAEDEVANASLREHWTMEIFREAGTRVEGQSTHEQNVRAALADGGAWFKLVLDRHTWDSVWGVTEEETYEADSATGDEATDDTPMNRIEERTRPKTRGKFNAEREAAKKEAGCPFVALNCDILTVYPVWHGNKLVEMVEITERPTIEVLEEYGIEERALYGQAVGFEEGWQYPRTCRFIEHWTEEFVTYVMDGVGSAPIELEQIQHSYGWVPYYFIPGILESHWRGRKVGRGIGSSKLSLVRYRQFVWKLVVNIAAQTAGTPMKHTRPRDGEPADADDEHPEGDLRTWQLNEVLDMAPGEDIAPIIMPGVPDALRELLELLNRQISDLDTPRMNANLGSNLDGAGFAIAQILTEAKTRFDPFLKHIEQAYTKATRDLWCLARDHLDGEKIPVHYTPTNAKSGGSQWLEVDPAKDLKPGVGVRWEIDPSPPTASIVLARYWIERLHEGLAHFDQAVEALGDNPDEVRRGKIADRIRNEGFVKDYENTRFLETLKAGDLLREAMKQGVQSGVMPGLPPGMQQQLQAAQGQQGQQGWGQPMAQPPGGAAQGAPIMPDQGALAASNGGAMAIPSPAGNGGNIAGIGPGMTYPQQAMQAGVQNIGH